MRVESLVAMLAMLTLLKGQYGGEGKTSKAGKT